MTPVDELDIADDEMLDETEDEASDDELTVPPPAPPIPPVAAVDETVVSVPVDVVVTVVVSAVEAVVEFDVPPDPSSGKNLLKSCKQEAAMSAQTMRHIRWSFRICLFSFQVKIACVDPIKINQKCQESLTCLG